MKFSGFDKVFSFTLAQQLKTRSFKVMTLVLAILIIIGTSLINIIPALTGKDSGEPDIGTPGEEGPGGAQLAISQVYLLDETDLGIDVGATVTQMFGVPVSPVTDEASAVEQLKTTASAEVLLTLEQDAAGLVTVTAYRPADESLTSSGDVDMLLGAVSSTIYNTRLVNAGISPDQVYTLTANVNTQSVLAGEEIKSTMQIIVDTVLPMALCILLFYMIFMYGTFVSQSIVTEKSSRVMELLLTSIKPLAVVTGKCLAMGLVAVAQFALFIGCAVLGFFGGGEFAAGVIDSTYTVPDISSVLTAFSPVSVIAIIVIFVMGFALYATVGALCGSTVSRAEELQQANMPISLMAVAGFYLAYFAPTVSTASGDSVTVLDTVAALVPFSSPFYLPGKLLTGGIDPLLLAGSLAILAVSILLVLMFTAKVYAVTILHTGNRLKLKDLFSIAKNS